MQSEHLGWPELLINIWLLIGTKPTTGGKWSFIYPHRSWKSPPPSTERLTVTEPEFLVLMKNTNPLRRFQATTCGHHVVEGRRPADGGTSQMTSFIPPPQTLWTVRALARVNVSAATSRSRWRTQSGPGSELRRRLTYRQSDESVLWIFIELTDWFLCLLTIIWRMWCLAAVFTKSAVVGFSVPPVSVEVIKTRIYLKKNGSRLIHN